MGKMRNRKGDLTQNVLSLIIAALGIALLVFAAYKLYRANVENEEENATKLLNSLDEKIKNLKDGEIGRFPIRGVNGWYLTGWGKDEQGRPDKCFFNSCVCVCKSGGINEKDSCQKNGICRDLKYDKVFSGKFINYKNDLLTVDKFFEDPEKYPVYDQVLGQDQYYLVKGGVYFPKGSNLLEIIVGIKGNKIYIIKWDDVGHVPRSEEEPLPDIKK